MNDFNFTPQGWECPKCKRVYSPTTIMCIACPQHTKTITTTTTDLLVYQPSPSKWDKLNKEFDSALEKAKTDEWFEKRKPTSPSIEEDDSVSKAWNFISKCKRVTDEKYGDCFPAELVYTAIKIAANK